MGTYSLMGPVQSVAAASDASSKLRNVRCASQSARGNVARIHALAFTSLHLPVSPPLGRALLSSVTTIG